MGRDRDEYGREPRREREREHDRESSSKRRRSHSPEPKKHRKRDETDEERRLRKAAKKASSRYRKDESARLAAAELAVYSGADQRFHDAHLDQQFVWGKKHDRERAMGYDHDASRQREEERKREAALELERLNARRAEREREQRLREQENQRQQHMSESAMMEAWYAKEDDFHLQQAMRRAEIRAKDNRAKPIDLLALNLKWSVPKALRDKMGSADDEDDEVGLDVDLEEPYLIMDNLTLDETEELADDINMYLKLEKLESNLAFWRAMSVVCSATLDKLRSEKSVGRDAYAEKNLANKAVRDEIDVILQGKTLDELKELQQDVQAKLRSGEPLDVEFWEAMLGALAVEMAKTKLRDMHEVVLQNRLEFLRKKQRDEAVRQQQELASAFKTPRLPDGNKDTTPAPTVEEIPTETWSKDMEPPLITKLTSDDQQLVILDPAEELAKLLEARRKLGASKFVMRKKTKAVSKADEPIQSSTDDFVDAYIRAEEERGDDLEEEGDEVITIESEPQAKVVYNWEDKYRPRKPRYFNKVHTGYEWNKYNQTHYDTDNPPPKVVQAYRFTIFCPDLVDMSKTPQYNIIREPGNEDTCILHFKIGPPYEDIAFRIVNREWEFSHKRGFKCVFDRGVLQLHFNFKRTVYRK